MKYIIPEKLQPGDEVRIISLARSASDIDADVLERSTKIFKDMQLIVSFGKNMFSQQQRGCPSDLEKVSDLHEAFLDINVKCILVAIGGFNSNQLLGLIDWSLIANNPKIFAGFSDITVLNHAILAKTRLVTYSSPNFYCFGLPPESSYSAEYFIKCLMAGSPSQYRLKSSPTYYDYPWEYDEKTNRDKIANPGITTLQEGTAEGTMIGGNMCSLNLLNGTKYFPKVDGDIILCIEDDSYDSILETFERNFQSVVQQRYFKNVKGILIGRFQNDSKRTEMNITDIIKSKCIDRSIPVAYNVDFGHTDPKITFPVGGKARINLMGDKKEIIITLH